MSNFNTPPDYSSEWMVVYLTNNHSEAYIVAGRLQSEDIPAWVHQPPAGSAMGITVGLLGEIRVLVDASDYDRAMAILDAEPDELTDDVDRIVYGLDEDESGEDDPDDDE